MPLLTPLQGEIITALATIVYGITVEKWYVSKYSISFNVVTWFVLLFTIDLEWWIMGGMAVWLFAGYLFTRDSGNGGFKQLFGSKVFGSLWLLFGLREYFNLNIHGIWILVFWGIITGIVMALGKKYNDDWS